MESIQRLRQDLSLAQAEIDKLNNIIATMNAAAAGGSKASHFSQYVEMKTENTELKVNTSYIHACIKVRVIGSLIESNC